MKRLPRGKPAQIMGSRGFQTMYTAEQMRKAIADEREACAGLVDEAKANIWEFHPYEVRTAAHNVCTNLAVAIRARGQT